MKHAIDISGSLFDWDLVNGEVHFENERVVLFWVDTAFKTLFDTIEEIAGHKESRLVLETSGYRTGTIVSDFYRCSLGKVDDILGKLPTTYVTAGWGDTEIVSYSKEGLHAVIRVRNSWEYQVNKEQGKNQEGTFLPGHWAGVLTGLFGEKMWYKVNRSQLEGDPYSEYEFNHSDITPSLNVSALIEEQTNEMQQKMDLAAAERTHTLSSIIKEISSPIIPVLDSILVVPLVGRYDETRGEELLNRTLLNLPGYKADYLIIDATSLIGVDEFTLNFIQKFVAATSLLGTRCLLVGISAEFSIQIAQSGHEIKRIPCFSVLQQGIHYALGQMGLCITKKNPVS
ncbi:STAS domain-containing protein [Rossellomorea marisflavi]|uniref:Fis family transcriptional regulator n=1 Tax=Rossellomorea marisflavi TaxID=189381 RepID=A0A163JJQ3_9BACI|nr:STAS domain-containing protein [Rossellomorea marisflavi]KZE45201.1 Fis family transcriptional regulator [Rossellomorea marisflavi]